MNVVTSIKNCTSGSRTDLFSFKRLPAQYCMNIFYIWCSNLLELTLAPQSWCHSGTSMDTAQSGKSALVKAHAIWAVILGPAQSSVKCHHRGPAFAFPALENIKAQHSHWHQGGCSQGPPRRNSEGLLMVPHSSVLVQSHWLWPGMVKPLWDLKGLAEHMETSRGMCQGKETAYPS